MPEGFHVVHANIARRRAAADDPVMAGSTECPDRLSALAEASSETLTFRDCFEAPA